MVSGMCVCFMKRNTAFFASEAEVYLQPQRTANSPFILLWTFFWLFVCYSWSVVNAWTVCYYWSIGYSESISEILKSKQQERYQLILWQGLFFIALCMCVRCVLYRRILSHFALQLIEVMALKLFFSSRALQFVFFLFVHLCYRNVITQGWKNLYGILEFDLVSPLYTLSENAWGRIF